MEYIKIKGNIKHKITKSKYKNNIIKEYIITKQ